MAQKKTAVDGYDWFQRKLKGIEAGDVFSIPLVGGGFGFGRVLDAHPGAMIAEFFRIWKEHPKFDSSILETDRLFAPTGFFITDIEFGNRKRPWKVIHKDPSFYPEDLYDLKFSQSHDGRNWTYYTLRDHRKTLGPIPREDVEEWRVPSALPQHPDQITEIVERKLRAERLIPG